MTHHLEHTASLLRTVPPSLDALLRPLPEVWTLPNEGAGTWSVYDTIGHLVHLERNHRMQRIDCILRHGETQPFEPVDRWAQSTESAGKNLEQLLDEFAMLRTQNLEALQALGLREQDLQLRGTHSGLGTITLSEVLASWAVHDLTHVHQISRILAHQYREAVGPWLKYFGVLKCEGHSE